jgi:hypothetical protein
VEISHPEIPTFPQGTTYLKMNIQDRQERKGF